MKALNIIATAYRATLEEQDDTIVWLTHAMRTAGADVDVLLRRGAVNYAVADQSVAPLTIGDRTQRHAPDVTGEIARLVYKGANVYVAREDVEVRGLDPARLLPGLTFVDAASLPGVLSGYDQVWSW